MARLLRSVAAGPVYNSHELAMSKAARTHNDVGHIAR